MTGIHKLNWIMFIVQSKMFVFVEMSGIFAATQYDQIVRTFSNDAFNVILNKKTDSEGLVLLDNYFSVR